MPFTRRRALPAILTSAWVGPALPAHAQSKPSGAGKLAALNLQGLDTGVAWSPDEGSKTWLYLDFWASWCGPCRLSFPWMNRMHEQWQAQGLRIVAVTVDRKREDALGFLRTHPAKFQVAFDTQGTLARQLEVKTMPTSLLVAPDGRIMHRHEGFTASLGDKAAQTIKEALGA